MESNLSEAIQFTQTVSPSANLPDLTGEEGLADLLAMKKQLVQDACLEHFSSGREIPSGLGIRRMRRDLREITKPVTEIMDKRLRGKQQEELTDYVARLYYPERKPDLIKVFSELGEFFLELQKKASRARLKIPQNEEMLTFIKQLAGKLLDEISPLTMFAVACPRFGENDEYDRLEMGVSQTARTYLYSLPTITKLLTKYKLPFRGILLVNDTEDELLEGSLLARLGLSSEKYHALCQGNVVAIKEALNDFPFHLRENLDVCLFTEFFPQFKKMIQQLEKRLYQLMQRDEELYKKMVATAKKRFERHQKILGGSTDFAKHLYLTLHYTAEYMTLGYLCRKLPVLNGSSFIVNYNSPNVIYFNLAELLAKAIQKEPNPEDINPIPVFQVKFY